MPGICPNAFSILSTACGQSRLRDIEPVSEPAAEKTAGRDAPKVKVKGWKAAARGA